MASPAPADRPDRCVFCFCTDHGSNRCEGSRIDASTGSYVPCTCDGGKGVRFLEVPYELTRCWSGVAWAEVEAHSGLPGDVRGRLWGNTRQRAIADQVTFWADVDAYATAHDGSRRPRAGRAWLVRGSDGLTRVQAGVMNQPMVVGQRKHWRW